MFWGGQVDITRCEFEWSRLGQICGLLECLCYELLATPQGACSAERDLQKMAVLKEICKRSTGTKCFGDIFFQTHDDARDQLFRTFPSGKSETCRREHGVYWFLSSVYWFPIWDGRNCELFNSMMTQICSRNRPHRVVKWRMSSYELNPPKQKGVNLEGLGGWTYKCQFPSP